MNTNKLLAALLLAAGTTTAHAQFVANEWGLNTAQSFNKVDGNWVATTTDNDAQTLTIDFPATAAGTLGRVEVANKLNNDITFGRGRKVLVMKLEFEGCTFADYVVNFNLMRQLKADNKDGEQLTPYLSPNASAMAVRYNNDAGDESTVGYYFRDLSGVYTTADFDGADWVVPGGKFTNGTFTLDDQQVYGRSYVGVRIQNGTSTPRAIGEGAKVRVAYIGVATLGELGIASVQTNSGKYVRRFIEDRINRKVAITIPADRLCTFSAKVPLNITGSAEAYTAKVVGDQVQLTRVDNVPANTGVLVRGVKEGMTEGQPYTIQATIPKELVEPLADNDFVANVAAKTTINYADGDYLNYVLAKNNDGVVAFYQAAAEGQVVNKGTAYLHVLQTNPAAAPAAYSLHFDGEGTTGITAAPATEAKPAHHGIYNLQGQRVSHATHGLYIIDGKKVFVK